MSKFIKVLMIALIGALATSCAHMRRELSPEELSDVKETFGHAVARDLAIKKKNSKLNKVEILSAVETGRRKIAISYFVSFDDWEHDGERVTVMLESVGELVGDKEGNWKLVSARPTNEVLIFHQGSRLTSRTR